ncbi:MAG: hypothetical protein ACD_20C00086G0033 [uncultured bacterium]|nr:MAG: hypothetical protein ACD_20C00086G0033 [uncultured bacterium]HBH17438.1 hypothetical protein [Cyanobacteria bacterium UBA9579]
MENVKNNGVINAFIIGIVSFVIGLVVTFIIGILLALIFRFFFLLAYPLPLSVAIAYFASNYVAAYLGFRSMENINLLKTALIAVGIYILLQVLQIIGTMA